MTKSTFLNKFFRERTGLLELILVAVVIGFSIELIASAYFNILFLTDFSNLFIGFGLLASGSIYFIYRVYTLKKSQFNIQAFVTYRPDIKTILPVAEYHYSGEIARNFISAFKENEALKKQWEAEPLGYWNQSKSKGKIDFPYSHLLLTQVTEYYILKALSLHLSSYFNKGKFTKEKLVTFERKNLPQILFENVFLELFSKPMDQRPAFVDDVVDKKGKSSGKIVASFKNGFRFEHFQLTLPKGSKITRESKNTIKIDTPRISMTFRIDFAGFNTNLPIYFEEFYLGIKDFKEIDFFEIDICCDVEFKLKTFLTSTGWDYFTWVDTFIDELERKMSKKTFLSEINWNTTKTVIRVMKNMSQKPDVEEAKIVDQ